MFPAPARCAKRDPSRRRGVSARRASSHKFEALEQRRLLTTVTIDFETDGIGVPTVAGDVVDDQYGNLGLTITTHDPIPHPAMIFDSANPTGGDTDLSTPGGGIGNNQPQGKILIISEDADSGDPDDRASGGSVIWTWDHDVDIVSVALLDVDTNENCVVRTFDAGNNPISTTNAAALGNNSFQELAINSVGVRRMEIITNGSLGVPGLVYNEEPPEAPLHGRMTGGGSIFLPAGAVGGSEGTRVTHGFQLHCASPPEVINNRLQINWGTPSNRFHLLTLTEVECFETDLQQPPPSAPIDTLVGVGNGRFSGKFNGTTYTRVAARIEFTLTDDGEPGVTDTSDYVITVLDGNKDGVANDPVVVLNTNGPQVLDRGNHQAHPEIPRLTTAAADVVSSIDAVFLAMDDPKTNTDQKAWNKVQELLALFADFETANSPTTIAMPGSATTTAYTTSPSVSPSGSDEPVDHEDDDLLTSVKTKHKKR